MSNFSKSPKTVGTTAGTVAAGDDSRITGAAQTVSSTSDVSDVTKSGTALTLTPLTVSLKNSYSKLYSMLPPQNTLGQFTWLALGDSVGKFKSDYIVQGGNGVPGTVPGGFTSLKTALGDGGIALGEVGFTTSGTVTSNTTDFANSVDGITFSVAASGSGIVTFGKQDGGGGLLYQTASKLQVFFILTNAGAGVNTFKVQSNLNNAGWVDETGANVTTSATALQTAVTNVDANNATTISGTVTVTKTTAAPYLFRVVALTGTPKIIRARMVNHLAPGCIYGSLCVPGADISSSSLGACPASILNPIMYEVAPTLVSFEVKDSIAIFAAGLSNWQNKWETACPNSDFVDIASTPIVSGDSEQVGANAQLRAAAITRNHFFFDNYGLFGNYTNLANSYGTITSDGIHPTSQASYFGATELYQKLGFLTRLAITAIYSTGKLFVDGTHGADGSGTRERVDRPFATITAAVAAAQSGDTVVVLPGTYTAPTMVAGTYNIRLEKGAAITQPVYFPNAGTYVIFGEGTITASSGTRSPIQVNNAAAYVTVDGVDLTCTITGYPAVGVDAAALVRLKRLTATSTTTNAKSIYWAGGTPNKLILDRCQLISSSGGAESVYGSTATIISYNSFASYAVNGTITVNGTLTAGTYVA